MRHLPLIPALAALSLAACTQPTTAPRLKPSEVLLQVTATGRAEVAPDEARITVGVSSTQPTAALASADNAQTMARVAVALDRFGVKPADMQTRNIGLSRIEYGPLKGRYRAENLVEVRMRDVARAGEAIALVTETGGNVVSGPQLSVANPDAADNAAYAAGYAAAKARAEVYAKAAGMKVARVLAIRDGADAMAYAGRRDGYGVELQAANAAPPPVSAGTDVRYARVLVDFALSR